MRNMKPNKGLLHYITVYLVMHFENFNAVFHMLSQLELMTVALGELYSVPLTFRVLYLEK